jgi:hypothetical protein
MAEPEEPNGKVKTSIELELLVAVIMALARVSKPKRRIAFLRAIDGVFRGYEAGAAVRRMRRPRDDAALLSCRRTAHRYFQQHLPLFLGGAKASLVEPE